MALEFKDIRSEILTFSRFALVGVLATAVHLTVSLLGVSVVDMPIRTANVLGFLVALSVSYFGHYTFSFRSTRGHRGAIARFLILSLISFACNALLVEALMLYPSLSDVWRLTIGIGIMPVASFIISRLWVY